jgi:K+ transporter
VSNDVKDPGGMCAQVGDSLRNKKVARTLLLSVALLATSMILGDGVLTPAISVISAVVGIQVAAPSISTSAPPLALPGRTHHQRGLMHAPER